MGSIFLLLPPMSAALIFLMEMMRKLSLAVGCLWGRRLWAHLQPERVELHRLPPPESDKQHHRRPCRVQVRKRVQRHPALPGWQGVPQRVGNERVPELVETHPDEQGEQRRGDERQKQPEVFVNKIAMEEDQCALPVFLSASQDNTVRLTPFAGRR